MSKKNTSRPTNPIYQVLEANIIYDYHNTDAPFSVYVDDMPTSAGVGAYIVTEYGVEFEVVSQVGDYYHLASNDETSFGTLSNNYDHIFSTNPRNQYKFNGYQSYPEYDDTWTTGVVSIGRLVTKPNGDNAYVCEIVNNNVGDYHGIEFITTAFI